MSKAFTRESDDLPERVEIKRAASALPPGVKNYFTPGGVAKLRAELEKLSQQSESQAVRQRLFEIQESLESAVLAPVPPPPWDQVLFGATVTVQNEKGMETVYRIVGVDEADIDRDWISWLSPMAKALIKRRVGETVRFKAPGGEQVLRIEAIRYDDAQKS